MNVGSELPTIGKLRLLKIDTKNGRLEEVVIEAEVTYSGGFQIGVNVSSFLGRAFFAVVVSKVRGHRVLCSHLFLSLSLTLSISHSLSLTHSLFHSLPFSFSHSLSISLSLTLSFSSLSLSLYPSLPLSFSLLPSPSPSLVSYIKPSNIRRTLPSASRHYTHQVNQGTFHSLVGCIRQGYLYTLTQSIMLLVVHVWHTLSLYVYIRTYLYAQHTHVHLYISTRIRIQNYITHCTRLDNVFLYLCEFIK